MRETIDPRNPNAFITKRKKPDYFVAEYKRLTKLVRDICRKEGRNEAETQQVLKEHSAEIIRLAREAQWALH